MKMTKKAKKTNGTIAFGKIRGKDYIKIVYSAVLMSTLKTDSKSSLPPGIGVDFYTHLQKPTAGCPNP